MALAYALEQIEAMPGVKLTNYSEFLERHPPALGSGNPGEYFLELRPWNRALAFRLRLQFRRAPSPAKMARAVA